MICTPKVCLNFGVHFNGFVILLICLKIPREHGDEAVFIFKAPWKGNPLSARLEDFRRIPSENFLP